MNPFQYGSVVTGDQFCNRTQEIRELRSDIDNGLNVLIYAPRRFGKTSLVQEVVNNGPYLVLFYDLMGAVDKQSFTQGYFRSIARSLERSADRIVRVLKESLHFKPEVSATFDESGTPAFSVTISPGREEPILEEVLELPARLSEKRKKRVVVIFDEFQEITRLGLEGTLRSIIQSHGSRVSYLFMGSKKSIMERMFFDRRAPFFQSVKHVPIRPIQADAWFPFLKDRFAGGNKTISDSAIHQILNITAGFPYYTQQIAYELYALTTETADQTLAQQAIDQVIAKEEDFFLVEWDALSPNQKKALQIVAQAGQAAIFGETILKQYQLTASVLKKAVDGLVAKDLVDRKPDGWYLQDPLLAHYLRTRFPWP